MNVIIVTKKHGQSKSLALGNWLISLSVVLVVVLVAASFLLGQTYSISNAYLIGDEQLQEPQSELQRALQQWGRQLASYKQKLKEVKVESNEQIDALTMRIGEMQARVIRLDALGKRLTEVANLDKGEFDFDNTPPVGGPEEIGQQQSYPLADLQSMVDTLEAQLDNRLQQLELMNEILAKQSLEEQTFIAGRPIKDGWLSSHYGYRTDPFTGKRAWHAGVDFAGKPGSQIVAVASGVVTWSADRSGFGNLVEISHGGKYSTRYAHCKELLVKVGDIVEKGQAIARMGSTGRSTGSHVHFEVLKENKSIDPKKFIYRASR